jgi:uncharacterized membrane protein (UPF0136 family)
MSSDQIILVVYIVLLELGGLMGFLKAGSKASLIASSIFAAVLVLICAEHPADRLRMDRPGVSPGLFRQAFGP